MLGPVCDLTQDTQHGTLPVLGTALPRGGWRLADVGIAKVFLGSAAHSGHSYFQRLLFLRNKKKEGGLQIALLAMYVL